MNPHRCNASFKNLLPGELRVSRKRWHYKGTLPLQQFTSNLWKSFIEIKIKIYYGYYFLCYLNPKEQTKRIYSLIYYSTSSGSIKPNNSNVRLQKECGVERATRGIQRATFKWRMFRASGKIRWRTDKRPKKSPRYARYQIKMLIPCINFHVFGAFISVLVWTLSPRALLYANFTYSLTSASLFLHIYIFFIYIVLFLDFECAFHKKTKNNSIYSNIIKLEKKN